MVSCVTSVEVLIVTLEERAKGYGSQWIVDYFIVSQAREEGLCRELQQWKVIIPQEDGCRRNRNCNGVDCRTGWPARWSPLIIISPSAPLHKTPRCRKQNPDPQDFCTNSKSGFWGENTLISTMDKSSLVVKEGVPHGRYAWVTKIRTFGMTFNKRGALCTP